MSSGYEDDKLVHHNWPTVSKGNDGMWHSTWTFEFNSQLDTGIDLDRIREEFSSTLSKIVKQVTKNPNETFAVSLQSNSIHLFVQTSTTSHLIGSENMSAIIELFKLVEQRFGRIEYIQSQPRDIWPPWWKPYW